MTGSAETDPFRPLELNLDMLVRGALAVSAIGVATTIVLLEALYVLIASNADNDALKKLGIAHQAYAVDGSIAFAVVFDLVFLPVMYLTARAYLRSHWKMALFSSLVWIGQIAFTTYEWKAVPDPNAAIPGDITGVLLLCYVAVRWRRMKAQE